MASDEVRRTALVADALARPLRGLADLGHRPLPVPLRLLHAPRRVRPDFVFLPREDLLTFEELARLARVFAGLGVRKLRLTGGEPLLRHVLEHLIAKLAAIGGIA